VKKILSTIMVAIMVIGLTFGIVGAKNHLTYSSYKEQNVYIDQGLTVEQIDKLADLIIDAFKQEAKTYDREMTAGQIARIWYDDASSELALKIFDKMLAKGLNIIPVVAPYDNIWNAFHDKSTDEQYYWVPPGSKALAENVNYQISLNKVSQDNELMMVYNSDSDKVLMERMAKGEFLEMLCFAPNAQHIAISKLGKEKYFEQFVKAFMLDKEDPVAEFANVRNYKQEIINWLQSLNLDSIKINSDDSEIKVKIGDNRTWLQAIAANMPSYEIYISPDWRTAQGTFCSRLPAYFNDNPVTSSVEFIFKDGTVTEKTIDDEVSGGYATKVMDMFKDAGFYRMGEIAFTDKRLSRIEQSLGDGITNENISGTWHMALGMSLSDCYIGKDEPDYEKLGLNIDCPLHVDFVDDSANLTVTGRSKDGKEFIVFQNGQFNYEFHSPTATKTTYSFGNNKANPFIFQSPGLMQTK